MPSRGRRMIVKRVMRSRRVGMSVSSGRRALAVVVSASCIYSMSMSCERAWSNWSRLWGLLRSMWVSTVKCLLRMVTVAVS